MEEVIKMLSGFGLSPSIIAIVATASILAPQIIAYIGFFKKLIRSIFLFEIALDMYNLHMGVSVPKLSEILTIFINTSKHCHSFDVGSAYQYISAALYDVKHGNVVPFLARRMNTESGTSRYIVGIYKKIPFMLIGGDDKVSNEIKFIIPRIFWKSRYKIFMDAIEEYKKIVHIGMEDNKSRFTIKRIVGTSMTSLYKSYVKEDSDRSIIPVSNSASEAFMFHSIEPLSISREAMFDLLSFKPASTSFKSLFFSDEQLNLISKIKKWYGSREWFEAIGIPWKIGLLLYGMTGTGKTSFVKKIAYDLDLPVFIFDLATLTNEELYTEWDSILSYTPCIALFEDFDSVFHHRKNVSPEAKLTFDAILNCIDGIKETSGVITVITTNHPEHIDPAMGGFNPSDSSASVYNGGTRPGRIDYRLEFKTIDGKSRKMLVDLMFPDAGDNEKQLIVSAGENMTATQFKNMCQDKIIERFEEYRGEKTL